MIVGTPVGEGQDASFENPYGLCQPAACLLLGRLGLLADPSLVLRLLLATGGYGNVPPRLAGTHVHSLDPPFPLPAGDCRIQFSLDRFVLSIGGALAIGVWRCLSGGRGYEKSRLCQAIDPGGPDSTGWILLNGAAGLQTRFGGRSETHSAPHYRRVGFALTG